MNASCLKNITLDANKRQLAAAHSNQHFKSGRWWSVARETFPDSSHVIFRFPW